MMLEYELITRAILGTIFALSWASTAGAQGTPQPLVGRWSEDLRWCDQPRGDEVPDRITTTGIEHFAAACRLSAWRSLGPRAWSAVARCSEEGEQGKAYRRYTFRLTREALEFSVSGEPPTRRVRCPKGP